MAPMTGGVADRQEDRLTFGFRLRQCVFAPWLPMDGVVLVLQQVRAGFEVELILAHDIGLRSFFR